MDWAAQFAGITIIVGNYGSGKTETAVNLALACRRAGADVSVADLDLVNPYFRSREARQVLMQHGIDLVVPPSYLLHADLPVLIPEVSGLLRRPKTVVILDVGGSDVGARVLAALASALHGKSMRVLQVINANRPETATVEGCLENRRRIEMAGRQTITGYIGNTHLVDETSVSDIYRGYDLVCKLTDSSQTPAAFITAAYQLMAQIDSNRFACPILPIYRQLTPPWRAADPMMASH